MQPQNQDLENKNQEQDQDNQNGYSSLSSLSDLLPLNESQQPSTAHSSGYISESINSNNRSDMVSKLFGPDAVLLTDSIFNCEYNHGNRKFGDQENTSEKVKLDNNVENKQIEKEEIGDPAEDGSWVVVTPDPSDVVEQPQNNLEQLLSTVQEYYFSNVHNTFLYMYYEYAQVNPLDYFRRLRPYEEEKSITEFQKKKHQ